MDQPAHTEKDRLTDEPGLSEVIEPSPAFLRNGIVTGIDSVRRHLPHASWAGPTAFRYVTPRGPTHGTVRSSNSRGQQKGPPHLAYLSPFDRR